MTAMARFLSAHRTFPVSFPVGMSAGRYSCTVHSFQGNLVMQSNCASHRHSCHLAQRLRAEPTPPEKAFSMGVRPATCSTGDVCMALDYLEDPAVHGITTQVCCPGAGGGATHNKLGTVRQFPSMRL